MKKIVLVAQVRENTIEDPGEGGRVILLCDEAQTKEVGLTQVQLIVNGATDKSIEDFPSTRKDKEGRYFQITCEEIDPPPPPPEETTQEQ